MRKFVHMEALYYSGAEVTDLLTTADVSND